MLLLWCYKHLAPLHVGPWFTCRRSVKRAWGTTIPHAQAWESIIWGSWMLNHPTTHGGIHARSLQRGSLLKLTQNAGSSCLKCKTSRVWSRVCLGAALISVSSNVPHGLSGALLGMFTSSTQAYVSGKHEPRDLRRNVQRFRQATEDKMAVTPTLICWRHIAGDLTPSWYSEYVKNVFHRHNDTVQLSHRTSQCSYMSRPDRGKRTTDGIMCCDLWTCSAREKTHSQRFFFSSFFNLQRNL